MKEYVVRAPAKVNLSLDVIGKRPDGYHEMRMVNHSVALSDILVFKENGQRIAVSCSDPKIPTDARNLVHRVAEKLQARFGIDRGVQIDIQKNIPSEAGLAGGASHSGPEPDLGAEPEPWGNARFRQHHRRGYSLLLL